MWPHSPSALSNMCRLRGKYILQKYLILPMLYFGLHMSNEDGRTEIFLSQLEALEQGRRVTKWALHCEPALIRVCGCLRVTVSTSLFPSVRKSMRPVLQGQAHQHLHTYTRSSLPQTRLCATYIHNMCTLSYTLLSLTSLSLHTV